MSPRTDIMLYQFSDRLVSCYISFLHISECGGSLSDSTPHIQEIKTSSFMEVSSKQDVRLDGTVPPNITVSVSTTSSTSGEQQALEDTMRPRREPDSVPDENHKCYPILQLARIKHPSDFTDTFLIQVHRAVCRFP